MYQFCIQVANLVIQIETINVRTYIFCKNYIVDKKPDFCVKISQMDIDRERENYLLLNEYDDPSDRDLETIAVFRKISDGIIDYNRFMIHGAAIATNDEGYIFIGKSGTGKTTHIMKWIQNIKDAYVINGDKPFIIIDDVPKVCGSPWSGKEHMHSNVVVPLKAIVIMERHEKNDIEQIRFFDAFPMLFQQVFHSNSIENQKNTLKLIKGLTPKVSFYLFRFNNMLPDSFEVARKALCK